MNDVGLPPAVLRDSSPGAVVAPQPAAGAAPLRDYSICDKQFMDDVTQLKALRSYMIRQAKSTEAGIIELGDLNLLRFDEKGRSPTYAEWTDLEHRSNELYQHLTEPDRRRFLYGQIPWAVIKTAGVLGVVALGTLIASFTAAVVMEALSLIAKAPALAPLELIPNAPAPGPSATPQAWFYYAEQAYKVLFFIGFLAWVAALGGIGSIAFIGMNALAVQEDATFDITNKKLIGLRVVLGALFAVVLTLPFGYHSFSVFITTLHGAHSIPEPSTTSIMLLLPFVLGFSTTLVIMILNQFVEGVQTFFGKRSSPPPAVAPPAAAAPRPAAALPPAAEQKGQLVTTVAPRTSSASPGS